LVAENKISFNNYNISAVKEVNFNLLEKRLAHEIKTSLRTALAAGAIFQGGPRPLTIFQHSFATAIRQIYSHKHWDLFQRFLKDGPYENTGKIPAKLKQHRLSDEETASAITFIYSYMVNCFQGVIMEMLAAGPCLCVFKEAQKKHLIPQSAKLYVGDAVLAKRLKGNGFAKGADLYFLTEHIPSKSNFSTELNGVVEVKSYHCSHEKIKKQLNKHILRAKRGLKVKDVIYPKEQVNINDRSNKVLRIAILPSRWRLPRTFYFEQKQNSRLLHVDEGMPQSDADDIPEINNTFLPITLKWSKEALASAAYEMTFWYMGKVGEAIYSQGVPTEWEEMTPAEAGCNAVKMMLYYAIRRFGNGHIRQRAIALYNSYCFGYALGANFRNSKRQRKMLWPEDLDEILKYGNTKQGHRLY
jgi:hypothetical protein